MARLIALFYNGCEIGGGWNHIVHKEGGGNEAMTYESVEALQQDLRQRLAALGSSERAVFDTSSEATLEIMDLDHASLVSSFEYTWHGGYPRKDLSKITIQQLK